MTYYFTSTKIANVKNTENNQCWQGNGAATVENSMAIPPKIKQRITI